MINLEVLPGLGRGISQVIKILLKDTCFVILEKRKKQKNNLHKFRIDEKETALHFIHQSALNCIF